jgi:hypothetical protein
VFSDGQIIIAAASVFSQITSVQPGVFQAVKQVGTLCQGKTGLYDVIDLFGVGHSRSSSGNGLLLSLHCFSNGEARQHAANAPVSQYAAWRIGR